MLIGTCYFKIYADDVIRKWQMKMDIYCYINAEIVNSLLMTDDQTVIANILESLQRALI